MFGLYLLIAVILLILFLLFKNISKIEYEISPQKARKLIDEGYFDVVIDVRTIREWNEGHIEGTIHIPIGELVKDLPMIIQDKNLRILFICQRGFRSRGVIEIAKKLGYQHVKSLDGAWSDLIKY